LKKIQISGDSVNLDGLMKRSRKKTYWMESLRPAILLILFIKSKFFSLEVRYVENNLSPVCKKILKSIENIQKMRVFLPMNTSLGKRSSYDTTLVYTVLDDIRRFCNHLWSNQPFPETESFREMINVYLSNLLYMKFAFLALIEHELKQKNNENIRDHIVYFDGTPLNKLLFSYLSDKNFTIRELVSYKKKIKFRLRPFFLLGMILGTRVVSDRVVSTLKEVKSSVWIEYAYQDIVDMSFSSWYDNKKRQEFDVVYYLDRADTPASKKITEDIESKKLKWIDTHFFSILRLSSFNLGMFINLLRVLFNENRRFPLWYKILKFDYLFWFFVYKSVYERFQVKIIIQHQETSWKKDIQAKAIEAVGGIMIGFHWSQYQCSFAPTINYPYHVFFVWGTDMYELILKDGNDYGHVLPSGNIITKNNSTDRLLVHLPKKTNFLMAIFDSSAGDFSHQSLETLSQFYLRLIKLIERNPDWGGLIKSKCWELEELGFLPNGDEIIERIKLLIKQDRLRMLDHTLSPGYVASCSDLSVCYGINSAGIIAGIYNARAIHWDCSGWERHFLYKDPDQRLIFRSLDEIEKAITEASKGNKQIGDFSRWKKKFNYFDDLNASKRVAEFIENFMVEVNKNDNADEALCKSVNIYIEKNRVGEDFFRISELWNE